MLHAMSMVYNNMFVAQPGRRSMVLFVVRPCGAVVLSGWSTTVRPKHHHLLSVVILTFDAGQKEWSWPKQPFGIKNLPR